MVEIGPQVAEASRELFDTGLDLVELDPGLDEPKESSADPKPIKTAPPLVAANILEFLLHNYSWVGPGRNWATCG